MLILAGVSIATLTGDNGVLTQASKAKIEECTYNKVFEDMKKILEKMGIYLNEEHND